MLLDEHYHLCREMPTEKSQIQFECDSKGNKCIVCKEDAMSKMHDGGLKDMQSDRKIVWIFPNVDKNRCPVRLVEKYLSLCPLYYKKNNFYLLALQNHSPETMVW